MRTKHVCGTCVLLVLLCAGANSNVLNTKCSEYLQGNKENIRNCLEVANSSLATKDGPYGGMVSPNGGVVSPNGALEDELHPTNRSVEAEVRKMKMNNLMRIIPFLLVPGFMMAGVLPWIVPGIKLIVMFVTMLNQMAFSTSLFSMIRGYIFDTMPEEHIVYLNHGYKHQKPYHPPPNYEAAQWNKER